MSCCHGRRWSCVAARDATTTLLPRRQWSSVAAGEPAELLPWPLDCLDTISDSDILKRHEMDSLKNEMKSVPDGWKIRTCFRSISWNYWRKGHTVHVDDISADPQHALLLPHLWDSRTEKCILRNLKTTPGFPAFSIYGGDIVYLMSKMGDKDAWMLCVDLGKKSLEVLKPYCASRATYLDETFRNTFISCAFSKYLNTTSSPRPCDAQVAAESAQSGALNDHLSLGDTALKTQQNTGNGDMMAHTQDTMASISSKPHSSHPV